MAGNRIPLSSGYHAESGATPAHLHNVYTTLNVGENERIWVGELSKDAIKAWQKSEEGRVAALGRLMGARTRVPASHQPEDPERDPASWPSHQPVIPDTPN